MHKTQKNNILLIFLIFLSLLIISSLNSNSTNSTEINEPEMISEVKGSTSWSNFSYIHITGADWSTVENYDWVQGSGSWADPYIIENITMDAGSSPTGSGITIESSTSVYFIIRNCVIYNAGTGFDYAGIKLINTNRGKILDNDCSNNLGAGIYLYNSDNNTIEGNTADYNNDFSAQGSGINIDQGSNNNTIHNNHCFNNRRDGIILYRSSTFNNVTYNNCSESGRAGVMLLNYANNNTIAYNNLVQNGVDQPTKEGIHVESSYGCNLLYNNVSNGKPGARGIGLLQANYHKIVGNIATNNPNGGIRIAGTASGWTASYNYIADNIITYNTGTGLTLYASAADHCNYNTVVNNTIQYNTGYGISLTSASYNNLSFNTAKDNGNDGIYLASSANYNDIIYYQGSVDTIVDYGTGNNIQELVPEGPILSNLVEITDPLEFGDIATIRINATDSDGVDTTLIEISGVNYTMTNTIGDIWEYNWTPSSLGVKPYTIWANDSTNKWSSISDSLTVQDTTGPTILNIWKNSTSLESGEILKIRVNATDLSGVDTVLFDILGVKHIMSNVGIDAWEYNWTSYSNGTIPYTIWINDTLNNLNSNTSSILVQDTVAPSLSNLYESADTLEVGEILTIQIDIADLGGVDTALLEIAGTNFTMYNIVGDTWEYNWTSDTLGFLPYTIWVNDTGGNIGFVSDSVTVQDTISPVLSDLSESADPIELGDTFIVQINVTDNYQIDEVLIEILGTNHTMMNNGSSDIWAYIWVPSSSGNFPYTIWVNDTTGNPNWISDNITIQNVAVPNMTDLYESADPLELGDTLTIQINIADLSGIDTVLMDLQGSNYSMSNIGGDIWEFVWNPSSIGFYPYTIWANDTLGNMNSTSDDITVQDTTAPNIFNLYESGDPVEIGNSFIVRVNITDVGGVNTTLIELDGANHTLTHVGGDLWEFIWLPSTAAIYPYTIWANDSIGNMNFSSNSITVEDTAIPNLTDLTEITDPLELGNTITIQINITDTSGINTTLIEILGVNNTMSNIGGTIWEYSFIPLSIGLVPYTIWANDTLGNWNSTSDDFTVEDTSGPTFPGLIEISDPLEFSNAVTIRIDLADYSGVDTALLEYLGTNYTMLKLNDTTWEFSWTPTTTGTHDYKIWANDTHNHWSYLAESVYVQDTTGPYLYNLFKSAEKVYLDNYITIRIKINDPSGVDTLLIEILGVNDSMDLIAGELWEYNWKSSSTGSISFIIWANDTIGNWNWRSGSFIVQKMVSGGEDTTEEPPDNTLIIIIIVISIGSTIMVSAYAIKSSKSKKVRTKPISFKEEAAKKRERLLKATSIKQVPQQTKPHKIKKKKTSESKPKPLTPEELADLAKTEKEVGINKQKFTCIVHRGSLHGLTIYLCKHCDTFYCERCAKVLKIKGDKCWTCGNDIDLEITSADRKELLEKTAVDLVEEIIQEKELLKNFIETDKDLDDIPKIREYLFSAFTSDELDYIDLFDLTVEEKKQFIKEYLLLDAEERKEYFDDLLKKY